MLMSNKIHVVADDLDLRIGDRNILAAMSWEIDRPGVVAIMGASGTGKSTLLALMTAARPVTSPARARSGMRTLFGTGGWVRGGDLLVDGIDVVDWDETELRRRIATVLQAPVPFSGSVLQNVGKVLECVCGVGPKAGRERVEDVLRRCGLADELASFDIDARNLSGGQLQRMAIARSLVLAPSMLCLDEPTSALDPVSKDLVERAIQEIAEDRPVVIVTHDPDQAIRLEARVLFLKGVPDRGMPTQLWADDSAENLLVDPSDDVIRHFVYPSEAWKQR